MRPGLALLRRRRGVVRALPHPRDCPGRYSSEHIRADVEMRFQGWCTDGPRDRPCYPALFLCVVRTGGSGLGRTVRNVWHRARIGCGWWKSLPGRRSHRTGGRRACDRCPRFLLSVERTALLLPCAGPHFCLARSSRTILALGSFLLSALTHPELVLARPRSLRTRRGRKRRRGGEGGGSWSSTRVCASYRPS
jgi:hypothetical protein